ncbi:MAG: nickel-responsive transcriptional regulator NikR [Denitrovibrio sp.]|nr:MAG: nickel-responsive transcriptional regulator NikR [Denitrovibrio sp.]
MSRVSRITVSIEDSLLEKFESYLTENGFPSRSEAVKHLIRNLLVDEEWKEGTDVAASLSIVYDHHKGGLMESLVHIQHNFENLVVCSQHVHLDHNNCMEVLVLKGDASDINSLYRELKSVKGVKHCSLMKGTTGGNLG